MKKIEWKTEYVGLEFGTIALAEFFGPKPSQTTRDIIQEIGLLSDDERLELFMILGGVQWPRRNSK